MLVSGPISRIKELRARETDWEYLSDVLLEEEKEEEVFFS
jgi:hypothetical protein